MDVLRDTEAALRSLHASLHGEVVNSPDDVWHLFTNGIRYMLGLPHVLLVIRSNDGEKWQIARQEEDVPPDAFKRCCRMLTEAKITPDSPESISRENGATLIARLPGERPMMEQAVLVGDLTDGAFLSRERTRLAMDLLEQFVSAYVQACALSRERQRLEIREKHIDIIDRILDSLGSEVSRVDQVLKKAAVELRHLGYRRVAFSLVDPGQKRIVGVVDASDGPNTAELTDYPLDDLNADVECYVFHNKRPVRIADARACADFPVSKRVVFKAGIIGMAIIPMILHEQVIGNMHVEREDQEEPTEEEVEDLTLFAKHLAVAIVQSEQVEMLQSALNQLPDPLVIVDRQRRIRYANRPGEDSFGISAGWQARPVDIDCAPSLEGEYTQTIGDAMDKKQQLVRFMEIDSGKSRDRISFAVAPISDWNGQINGALVHVRNITYLHSLLDAFKFAGAAEGAQELLEALLEGSRVLMERKGKHLWGRLYLVDPYDENYLIGYAQYGLSDEEAQAFEMGEIRLQRSDDRHNESWWCIDDRAPKVYSWSDKRKDREEYTTPFGLPVINLIKPSCPLMVGKRPGDQWIDFPLWARDRDEPVGKISLDCPENLDPYDFEWLHLLAEVASALIEASLRRKELESEKAKWFRKAAENAIGEIAHHIIGRHAALGTLLFRYCQREKELPELENLNRDFERMLGKIDRDVQRASNQLRPKDLDKERTDVVGLLRELFEDSLPPSPFQFRSSDDVIWAEVDREEVEHIFQELFINSRKAQVNGRELLITAELSTFERNDRCWLQVVYSDNGCGIPHNAKESVFKEFVSSDQRPGRTGLGLTIMRRIVEAHGGGIWERGTPGQGAEFVIEFPLAI